MYSLLIYSCNIYYKTVSVSIHFALRRRVKSTAPETSAAVFYLFGLTSELQREEFRLAKRDSCIFTFDCFCFEATFDCGLKEETVWLASQ